MIIKWSPKQRQGIIIHQLTSQNFEEPEGMVTLNEGQVVPAKQISLNV